MKQIIIIHSSSRFSDTAEKCLKNVLILNHTTTKVKNRHETETKCSYYKVIQFKKYFIKNLFPFSFEGIPSNSIRIEPDTAPPHR